MKRKSTLLTLLFSLLAALLFAGTALAEGNDPDGGKVVVANRNSGSISIIDTNTDAVIATINLPAGDNTPEPMYVVYSHFGDRFFVGDRGNDRVVVFDADNFSVIDTISTGAGVFHMWADSRGRQLWVNNDADNTATVIDTKTLAVIATVPMPADLVGLGGKPHDVILDRSGRFAWVTMLGFGDGTGYVVQFSTRTFAEVNRVQVGDDPHLSLATRGRALYVPVQGSSEVSVFDRYTLAPITAIDVPNAHGAGMRADGKIFYTTNIAGGGADGIFTIDTRSNTLVGQPVDTPYPTPHNIALTPDGTKLYLTHSGATADQVTIYSASKQAPVPVYQDEVTVGLNPFGLAYIP